MMLRAMMSSGGFLPTMRSAPGASMSTSIFKSSSDPCIGTSFSCHSQLVSFSSVGTRIRLRRESTVIRHDVDHDGPVCGERFLERRAHFGGPLYAQPHAAERCCHFGEIDRREAPHLPPALVRIAAVCTIEVRDLL